jgi:coenzyme PQQ synthesis protein D (PqqD)
VELHLRREALEWRETDDEILALDVAAATYLMVKGSGVLLWRELADGASPDELSAALADAYGIDAETASRDVDRFVARLRDRGLLA